METPTIQTPASASEQVHTQPGRNRVHAALHTATQTLHAERTNAGHWEGELSSSALSTATALIALNRLAPEAREEEDPRKIQKGLLWLSEHQNADGGWGDTIRSRSNISTTALVWAAFGAALPQSAEGCEPMRRCQSWLQKASGCEGPGWEKGLAEAIRKRYGKDRTFSVPILMACTLSGRLGAEGWREVPALPFELAALPRQFYSAVRMPVVSYALPALIAIGQVIHHHSPSANPVLRLLRNALRSKTSNLLERIQPVNGGFLEATPLTSFVLMSLAACEQSTVLCAKRCAAFLRASVRPDGSWPIDTNLATWVSTLAVNALAHQTQPFCHEERSTLREWLLGQQYREMHPYTHAAPGGWAWTPLPGGVPDADDTPGALLALLNLGPVDARTRSAGALGVRWLLDLQNADGGIPTFCKGWGTLPFDRSGEDLTAHTLRAWAAWLPQLDLKERSRVLEGIRRALAFLEQRQRPDGTWVPLWFGNEHLASEENPVWGTSRVLLALKDLRNKGFAVSPETIARGTDALVSMQQPDGGWAGGPGTDLPSSVEETGLALEALAGSARTACVDRATLWLVERVESGLWKEPAPIGFYFARLWYFERLYPQLATVAGLGAALRHL